jgi:hypothetical protein
MLFLMPACLPGCRQQSVVTIYPLFYLCQQQLIICTALITTWFTAYPYFQALYYVIAEWILSAFCTI